MRDQSDYKRTLRTVKAHQFGAMARGINVIAALLACATAASAVLHAPFPHGKTTVYRYKTVVKASATEDVLYASLFALQGTLDIVHDTRDPELVNAYNVVISNIATDMFNGYTGNYTETFAAMSADSAARVIQEPFLIVYHANGTFQGVKIPEHEAEWSKNMKMAMASTLQLDLASMDLGRMSHKRDSFVSREKTIYGDCSVSYDVNYKKRLDWKGPKVIRVNKTFSPMECDGFPLHEFNNVDIGQEKQRNDDIMFTKSSRLFKVEKQGEGVLIKKLDAYGMIRVLSANAASYPHFVITNMTFELLEVKDKTGALTPLGVFVDVPITRDVTYRRPLQSYAPGAAIDFTQGRRVVNQTDLIHEANEMLIEAIDYLEENHVTPDGIDRDRARVINKMLHVMTLMNEESLGRVSYEKGTESESRIKKIGAIFIGLVSQVGTTASCRYARKLIVNNQVPTWLAVDMLGKLALSVKLPTIELLAEMEELARLSDPTSVDVRKAGILSFATLVYRTFKNAAHPEASPVLNGYLQDFADRVMSEPTVDMKIVYLMALRNVQVGKVADLLAPIVDGSVKISEDPERIRLLAIWAIDKSLEKNYTTAVRVLWPVMENASLPTKLRLAAYEILMRQAPTREDALRVHQYVSSQDNRHFYQYHYTNLDSIAKTVDKKNENLRAVIYSIFESTKYQPKGQKDIRNPLSGVHSIRFVDDQYWYSEKLDLGVVVNELTGHPEVMRFEYTVTDRHGAVSDLAIQLHVEGHPHELRALLSPMFEGGGVTQSAVRDLLARLPTSLPALKDLQADVVMTRSGRVFMADHCDFYLFGRISNALMSHWFGMDRSSIDDQHLEFDRLYEKHVTSELGVPVVIENRVPIVRSVTVAHSRLHDLPHSWDIAMELKTWKHADDSMSVYNPIADAWHSVRSAADAEFSLPFSFRFVLSTDDTGRLTDGFWISFPELPATIPPVAGLIFSGEHLVTVDEIGAEALNGSCPSCASCVPVWDGRIPVEHTKPYHEDSTDSIDLGLKFTVANHRGTTGFMSEAHLGYGPQWNVTFDSHIPQVWLDPLVQLVWSFRGTVNTAYLNMQFESGYGFLRIEPSAKHPISHINFADLHEKSEDLDRNETKLECLHAYKMTFGGTLDVISAATNSTARLWKFGVDLGTNRGHLAQTFSLHMTCGTPGEKNRKICVDWKKNYPVPPEDDLRIGTTKEEIDSKLTIAHGLTDGDECVWDQSVLAVAVKAQLSDEQKRRLKDDLENSQCSKDKKNPSLVPKTMVPRTYNCMNEAIRYTTPRKYTFDVTHKELMPFFARLVYRRLTDRREPRETGDIRFSAEIAMETNRVDFQWMTNTSELVKSSDFPRTSLLDFNGLTLNSLWDFPLDNSRFRMRHLFQYTMNDMKMCSIYPKVVMTGDGEYVPFAMPSDQWVLISGDHWYKEFAIFAKQPKPDLLSFLIFYKSEAIHFYTRESDNIFVAKEDGCGFSNNRHILCDLTFRKKNDHFVVRLSNMGLTILVGPNDMSITFDRNIQGRVSGLCGHLNGTHPSGAPEFYSISEIAGY